MLKEWGAGLERDIELEREGKTRVIMKERDRSREQDGEDLRTGGVGGPARDKQGLERGPVLFSPPGGGSEMPPWNFRKGQRDGGGIPPPQGRIALRPYLTYIHTVRTYHAYMGSGCLSR